MKARDFLFASGSLTSSLIGIAFGSFAQFFYLDKLKVRPELIGIAMFVYGIWNAVNDPAFGYISDRTRTRFGRRRPYIFLFSLPLAAAFTAIWLAPRAWVGHDWRLFWYYLVALFFFDGFFTIVFLNWSALFPEMYRTERARTSVSGLRQVMMVVGYIIGFAITPLLYTKLGWGGMGLAYGGLTAAFLYLGAGGLREEQPAGAEEKPLQLRSALAATFANRAFVIYLGAFFLLSIIFALVPAVLPFYSKYVLGVPEGQSTFLFGTVFLSALAFLPLWIAVANRRGAHHAILWTCASFAAGALPFLFARNLLTGLLAAMALGPGISGMMLLLDVILADIIDDDRLRTRTNRAGFYNGSQAFFGRLAVSIQGLVLAYGLKLFGYVPDLAAQSAGARQGIRLLVGIVPFALALGAFLFFRRYPLRREIVAANKRRLEEEAGSHGFGA